MKFSARVVVFLAFLFLFLVFKSTPVFAQTVNPQPQNLHNYTQNVMIEVMSSLGCLISGVDAVDPSQKCLGIADGKIGPVDSNGGAIGAMGNLIAMTYTAPIHTSDFVSYMAGNFGLTKSAYAANDGFQQLSPLIKMWGVFRDLTYLLFVLIFLIIGFGIMLRVHIDPRTVMTIENQIPKIIIGLILVTFSFAIIGLLIDFMWLLTYLSIGVFDQIFKSYNLPPAFSQGFTQIQGLNPLQVANNLNLNGPGIAGTGIGSGGLFGIVTTATDGVRQVVESVVGGPGSLFDAISKIPIIGGVMGGLANAVLSLVLFLVLGIAILFSLFRLWFTLIKAYVMILIVAVFSPFWVLAGIIPGSKLTFENLLREVGSNLITFPATIIMFLLAKTFMDLFAGPQGQAAFVPPLVGNPGNMKAIGALAGFGIILLTADVNTMMRKALKAPEFDFSAIFKAIGVGTGAVNPISALGRATQFGSTLYWARQTPGLRGILARMEGPEKAKAPGPAPH